MEMDHSHEALDWDDDLDESDLEDEFDAVAEFAAESTLLAQGLQVLGLGQYPGR